MMKKYTLGLDLGSNSVGWAIVSDDPQTGQNNIISGARIFPEGTENTKSGERSRNEPRRNARQARRQHDRRSRRKKKLNKILCNAGVYPENAETQRTINSLDPYSLRKKGLDEELRAEEFSRVLLHLNQRRGFKSNLKAQGDEAKKQGDVKKDISSLTEEITQSGARTLGEYLALKHDKRERIRGRHTSRDMYRLEFDALWQKQASFRPDIWTEELKNDIADNVILFQRPLKSQSHLIGECELEPGEKRCPKASWYAQQFRILQDVTNLRILGGRSERPLTNSQRLCLVEKLMSQVSPIKVDIIKNRVLELGSSEHLNFERTERDKMEGNHVEASLRRIFKKSNFSERVAFLRETVWETMVNEEGDEFRRRAEEEWNLTDEEIAGLFKIKRPRAYMNYSLKAIRKMLPFLEEGKDLHTAKVEAGYNGQNNDDVEGKSWLPALNPDDYRNPVVVRALSETRKVVNAIVRKYGSPSHIVIEMARETKGTIRSRQERTKKNQDMAQWHETIRGRLRESSISPNR